MKTAIVLLSAGYVGAMFWTIREAASGTGIYVGTALNYEYHLNDTDYCDEAGHEFSLITAENACKMT